MCSIHACSFWACVGNFALVAVSVWMMRSIANGALLRSIAQNVPTNCGYFRAFGEPGTLWAIFFLLCIVFLGKEIRFLAAGSAPPLPHVVQAMSAAMSVRPLYVCTIFICRKNLITLIMNFRYYNKQAYKWARLASSLCLFVQFSPSHSRGCTITRRRKFGHTERFSMCTAQWAD